jgi:hypothetical protein
MAITSWEAEVIRKLGDIELLTGNSNNSTQGTGTLEVVTATTSAIARTISNAKFVAIAIASGSGIVLGANVDAAISSIDFPYLEQGYTDFTYTVNPNSTFIVQTIF